MLQIAGSCIYLPFSNGDWYVQSKRTPTHRLHLRLYQNECYSNYLVGLMVSFSSA